MNAALAVVAAFDLLCSGTFASTDRTLTLPGYKMAYRLDLKVGRYCSEPCRQTMPLAHVTDTIIVLDDSTTTDGAQDIEYVNRESGDWHMRNSVFSVNGTCERRPFSGFPARKF